MRQPSARRSISSVYSPPASPLPPSPNVRCHAPRTNAWVGDSSSTSTSRITSHGDARDQRRHQQHAQQRSAGAHDASVAILWPLLGVQVVLVLPDGVHDLVDQPAGPSRQHDESRGRHGQLIGHWISCEVAAGHRACQERGDGTDADRTDGPHGDGARPTR